MQMWLFQFERLCDLQPFTGRMTVTPGKAPVATPAAELLSATRLFAEPVAMPAIPVLPGPHELPLSVKAWFDRPLWSTEPRVLLHDAEEATSGSNLLCGASLLPLLLVPGAPEPL